LHQPFLLAGTRLLDPDLLRIPPAHTELGRQFAQTSHSSFIGIQKLQTQIIRIGLGHRLVFAEIAETNLPLIGNPGYSDFGSALTAPEVDARRAQGQAQLQAADSQLTAAQARLASDEATSNHLEDAAKTPGVVAGNDLIVAEKTVEADRANAKAAEENVNAARQALNSFTTLLEYLQVTAPFDGVITERNVHPGALVGPATDSATSIPMLRLEPNDHMRLTVPVPQAYLSGIQGGQKVEFKVPAYPDRKFTGTIARVSDSVDRQTRTMPVELDVWNR